MKKSIANGTTILAQTAEKSNTFDQLKRNFEKAYSESKASGTDCTTELYALAHAIAQAVNNKCIDPQRKTATERENVSNNGFNPALMELRRGMVADMALLENTRHFANESQTTGYNKDGDTVTIVNADAEKALGKLIDMTISDGMDLVQETACALLELGAQYATDGANWLDMEIFVHELSKKVYIQRADSKAYKDRQSTPIQETYRHDRRYIQNSRAMQTDPRNGYLYLEDTDPDTLETYYIRLGKCADLGGYASDINGNIDYKSQYTATQQIADDMALLLERLQLTDRQAQIVKLRLAGYGVKAIASYLGVSKQCIQITLKRLQENWNK